jgi:NDP-4-keto-2,6-dideoxyhexose 3-C-methyltransferase
MVNDSNKSIYGYGASTKANIILNLCEINVTQLPKFCDANPEKYNLITPGTNLPIIPKEEMRKDNPDYLMVFIWHFRKEVLIDEYDYIMNGGQMIFILPRIHIVNKENYDRYLKTDFDELSFSL